MEDIGNDTDWGSPQWCPECFSDRYLYAVRRQRNGQSYVGCINCGACWAGHLEEQNDYVEGLKAAPYVVTPTDG